MNPLDGLTNILQNEEEKESLAEALVADLIGQLDVMDPTDDGDELIGLVMDIVKSTDPSALKFLEFLLGVEDLEEWLAPFLEVDDE